MCIDTDLFGEVIITVDDVNLWLDITARMHTNSYTRREHYAQTFDVANKIKQSKLDGSFYLLMDKVKVDADYAEKPLSLYATKYVECKGLNAPAPVCPDYYHHCSVKTCPVYLRVVKADYNRARNKKYGRIKH